MTALHAALEAAGPSSAQDRLDLLGVLFSSGNIGADEVNSASSEVKAGRSPVLLLEVILSRHMRRLLVGRNGVDRRTW